MAKGDIFFGNISTYVKSCKTMTVNNTIVGGKVVSESGRNTGEQRTIDEKATIPAQWGVHTVEIQSSFADVFIKPTEGSCITAHLHGNGRIDGNIELEARGGSTIKITVKTSDVLNMTNGRIQLDIGLPTDLCPHVRVSSCSGDISLESVSAQQIDISSIAGAIMIGETRAISLNVDTKSGDVILEQGTVFGDIGINTIGGAVDVNSSFGRAKIETISGVIGVDTEAEEYFVVEASTVIGDIDIRMLGVNELDVSMETMTGETRNQHCSVAHGHKAKLDLTTTTGDISVR